MISDTLADAVGSTTTQYRQLPRLPSPSAPFRGMHLPLVDPERAQALVILFTTRGFLSI